MTTPTTATDYAALTNAELNAVAARSLFGVVADPEAHSNKSETWFWINEHGKALIGHPYEFSLKRGTFSHQYEYFIPATDYNHAAQLRQECERRGLKDRFINTIKEIIRNETEESKWWKENIFWEVANATPRQITIAAIRAVEGNTK